MPGYNEIILEVEGKKYTSDNVKFKYYQTQSVKTILGKFGEDGWTSSDDSKIEEFRMNECTGIVAVAGQKSDNFIFVGGGWGDRTYFVSLEDNVVIRLLILVIWGLLQLIVQGKK